MVTALQDGFTALIKASWNGSTKAVRALVDRGANKDAENNHNKKALDLAGHVWEVGTPEQRAAEQQIREILEPSS